MHCTVKRLRGADFEVTNSYRLGDDVLVDGIIAISEIGKAVPLRNLLATGNVEGALKALIAAGVQKKHSAITYAMDKQFALMSALKDELKQKRKQQVDLLLTNHLSGKQKRTVVVECKATFAFDTPSAVVRDALEKGAYNSYLRNVIPTRNCIMHFLSDTRFLECLNFLPDGIQETFRNLYKRPTITPDDLFKRYREEDSRSLIQTATIVAITDNLTAIQLAAVVIDLCVRSGS